MNGRPIHRLPDAVVNKIAAGEVVERPASVVKELLENSLDAGAERITVTIRSAGRQLISVMDDGHGMSSADCLLALERHATSKLSTETDLDAIA
ncbi:MAG: ATP-binding protein, partial [Candidatus Rokuibacteriota bacterium]